MSVPPVLMHPFSPRDGVGRHRFIAQLGGGGMADVYLAVASGLVGFTKLAVVKVLRSELAHDPEYVTMFLNEARLAARLNHANVVQTNEVGEDRTSFYLVMEYLDGQALHRLMRGVREWPLSRSLPPLLEVLAGMLAGLHYAHELRDFDGVRLNLVHRDVSPHNVFITYDGQVKLVDFGIAKVAGAALQTRSGVIKGKIAYMAPEQARGEAIDRRADVFSAGIILWEMLARARMWHGLADLAIYQRLLTDQLPSLRQVAPEAPAGLVEVCERATALEPTERFSTALEMRTALEPFLTRRGGGESANLGALLTDLFGGEREALQRRIETAISSNSGPHTLQPLPSPSSERSHASSFSFGSPPTATVPSLDAAPLERSKSSPVLTSRAKGRWLSATLAVGFVGVVTTLLLRGRVERATPPSSSAKEMLLAPSTSSAFGPAEASTIEVVVRVRPVEARLYLDDQPLKGNPFRGTFDRGGEHELRAEAPGYVTEKQTLSFLNDVTIDLALARQLAGRGLPHVPPPRVRGGPRAPGSTNVDEPLELPSTPPRRPVKPIDTESPY